MNASQELPVRMCIVVPLDDGTYEPYCIACPWSGRPKRTARMAETQARHHTCRKRGDT